LLREHLKRAGPALLYSDHLDGADGEAMFRHACAMGLEGIVSKRPDSRYKSGRCLSWVKVKNPDMSGGDRRREVVGDCDLLSANRRAGTQRASQSSRSKAN